MPLMLLEVMILAIKLLSHFFKNENASNNFTVADMCYFFIEELLYGSSQPCMRTAHCQVTAHLPF